MRAWKNWRSNHKVVLDLYKSILSRDAGGGDGNDGVAESMMDERGREGDWEKDGFDKSITIP